ncbi:GLEYA domain-containing protein [Hypoxylon sp. FL0543]|nr:GLEYA domain-containing protein [Hypoxylon sp. FL0543]
MQILSALLKLQLLAAGTLVVASPANQKASTGCTVVQWIIDILKVSNLATPYCASVLNVPTVTQTAFTTRTVPSSTATSTKYTKTTTLPTVTVLSTTVVPATSCTISPANKRDAPAELEERSPAAAVDKPAGLANAASKDISTACSCLSIGTQTTKTTSTITTSTGVTTTTVNARGTSTVIPTTTSTVTTTAAPTACAVPPTCNNLGVQWAEWDNTFGYNGDATYSQFDPESYKNQAPLHSGVITSLGSLTTQDRSLYSSDPWANSDFYVIDHRAYLFAPESGTYTIVANGVDDAIFIWDGPTAYSGWTRDNAAGLITDQSAQQSGSVSFTMNAGDYLPFRIMFVQAQGGAQFQLSITAPDGTVISNAGSPYLLQYPCNGAQFPAWGSET